MGSREADASGRTLATRQAERCAHDLEESAAGNGVEPFGGARGIRGAGPAGILPIQRVLAANANGQVMVLSAVCAASSAMAKSMRSATASSEFDLLAGADVFDLFNLDQAAGIFVVVRHCVAASASFALRGLFLDFASYPTACAPSTSLRAGCGLHSFAASRLARRSYFGG